MGAWVATVLRDLLHHAGGRFAPPAPRAADATRTGNAIAERSNVG